MALVTSQDWLAPLAVVGCDFRVASSRWRSLLVLDEAAAQKLAQQLVKEHQITGFVELNTCNRNEWIVSSEQPQAVAEYMRERMLMLLTTAQETQIEPYCYVGQQAARHLFRVVLGMESLVLGERQIAGQLFRALETARDRGTSSRILNGLGTIAGRLVRSGGRFGCLADASLGVHSLAARFLREHFAQAFASNQELQVAVIGMGEVGRRMQGLLQSHSNISVIAVNRTPRDEVLPLTDLAEILPKVDAAIVCTGAGQPVVTGAHLHHSEQPLLLIDLGIPEQVVRDRLPAQVVRVGIDEMTAQDQVLQSNRDAVQHAEKLIERALLHFRRYCSEPDFVGILEAIQERNQQLVGADLQDIVSSHFADLPEDIQIRLAQDLKSILNSYTHEVFGTIKNAAQGRVKQYKFEDVQ